MFFIINIKLKNANCVQLYKKIYNAHKHFAKLFKKLYLYKKAQEAKSNYQKIKKQISATISRRLHRLWQDFVNNSKNFIIITMHYKIQEQLLRLCALLQYNSIIFYKSETFYIIKNVLNNIYVN